MTAHDLPDGQTKHRLTVQEYLLLDGEGAFGSRGTELIGGEVYYMSPKHRPHALAMTEMGFALVTALRAIGSSLQLLTDISIGISEHDVLEPDFAISDAPTGEGILPVAAVKLVVEISDSTIKTDLGFKADLYAEAGVPEYWVVDLNENRVLMHASPRPDGSGYDGRLEVPFGAPLNAATIKGLTVETAGWVNGLSRTPEGTETPSDAKVSPRHHFGPAATFHEPFSQIIAVLEIPVPCSA